MANLEYTTNLTAWFEADGIPKDPSDTIVQFWLDGTGAFTRDLTRLAGVPTFTFREVNGRPVVAGNGDDAFQSSVAISNFIGGSAATVVAVVKVNSISTNNNNFDNDAIFSENTGANSGVTLQLRNQTPPVLEARNLGSPSAATIPITLGEYGVAIFQNSGTALSVGWNDPTTLTTSVTVATALMASNLNVMCSAGVAGTFRYLNGNIAAILFFNAVLSQINLAKVVNYLSAKYLSPNRVISSPGMRADALEQSRDVASRRLWFQRHPIQTLTAKVPLRMLDSDLLTDVGLASPTIPDRSAAGGGLKNSRPDRGHFKVYESNLDLDKLELEMRLCDRRNISHVYQESGLAGRASSLQRQGIMQSGNVARCFRRASQAWIVDPDSQTIVNVPTNAEKVADGGMLLEDASMNYLTRSSYISGLTGIGSSGTAVAGSSISLDTAPTIGFLFDTAVTLNSLKFTGSNPASTTPLMACHPVFTPSTDLNVMTFSLDHYDEASSSGTVASPLSFVVTRSSDSFTFNSATNAWSSLTVFNSITTATSGITRYVDTLANATTSVVTFAAGSNYILKYGIAPSGAADQVNHTFHAQLEGMAFSTAYGTLGGRESYIATSRIVTDSSGTIRWADDVHYYGASTEPDYTINNNFVIAPNLGTFRFKFTPLWNGSDVRYNETNALLTWSTGRIQTLFFSGYNTNPYIHLCYNATSSSLEMRVNALTTQQYVAYVPWSPVAGTQYSIAFRYTSSSEGELGLPANTYSVFVNGVKGTDASSPWPIGSLMCGQAYWSNIRNAVSEVVALFSHVQTPNGYVQSIEAIPYALTDQEIAAW